MIIEIRTYDLKVGKVQEVVDAFAKVIGYRQELSKLVGFWQTEIGPLNQIVHVWQYEDTNERARIRAEAAANDWWPPKIAPNVIKQSSEVFTPWELAPVPEPGRYGRFYEYRSYLVKPGLMPQAKRRWTEALPGRTKHSPVMMILQGDTGTVNKLVHIWAYEDLNQRQKIREDVVAEGLWPPKHGPGEEEEMSVQENKILVPVPFSPLQ